MATATGVCIAPRSLAAAQAGDGLLADVRAANTWREIMGHIGGAPPE